MKIHNFFNMLPQWLNKAKVNLHFLSWSEFQSPPASHQRRSSLLLLKCAKKFQRYSIYNEGDPNILEYFHELPKNSIDVINIKRITSPSTTSCEFSIFFDSKNLLEREDIRKTLTNLNYIFVPNISKSEEISWRFTCESQSVK